MFITIVNQKLSVWTDKALWLFGGGSAHFKGAQLAWG
jgi:hypothetical protein